MAERILIVDDEQEIADLVALYLKSENFEVRTFYSAAPSLQCVAEEQIDLAILDVMLPDMNGFTLCKQLRERYNFPILMLTAKTEETDKITGLTLGADDYITKPFRPLELVARVKAQLRRYTKYNPAKSASEEDMGDALRCKDLTLNLSSHECRVGDKLVSLTPTEFSILRILLEQRGKVVSAEELFHTIWADEYYCKSSNTISVHVRHLREKLGDTAEHSKYIKTVWGVGYQIER